jgi:hypothetical protein
LSNVTGARCAAIPTIQRKGLFTAEAAEGTGDRTGLLVEFDQSDAIFTHPTDKRTEDYVIVPFGELRWLPALGRCYGSRAFP